MEQLDDTAAPLTAGAGAALVEATSAELPVGTILPFVGRFPDALQANGWWVCAGQTMDKKLHEELFAAIGIAFGQPALDQFQLPDLRGWFLRGTTDQAAEADRAEMDPDWASRRPAVTLSATAEPAGHLGHTQTYATAAPRKSFTASVDHLKITGWRDDAGCADRPGNYSATNEMTFPTTGGDLETRPMNKYVSYVIKVAGAVGPAPVTMPVGALATFAGVSNAPLIPEPPVWRLCFGYPVSRYDAPELFAALQFIHGGVDANTFVLPDYRGWFQRGVSDRSGFDPDAELRTPAYPTGAEGYQGNAGNRVGSAQPYATAVAIIPFTTTIAGIPTSDASKRVAGTAWNLVKTSGNTRTISLSNSGGDLETRPVNVAVNWYVLSAVQANPDPPYPIGGVIASGSTLAANPFWFPCDGRMLAVKEFPALYQAIGNTYGGDATTFALPDYRGRFQRGAGYTVTVDGVPTEYGVGTPQDWATGKPVKAFMGTLSGFPNDLLGAHGATNTGNAGDDGTLTFETCKGGGDKETRPRNVYVNFYIRAT
jgi:microcystin-dependent protein